MTKEELERIKQAYYSGLDIQIWFSGYWEDFDIRDYSMFPEPFSENRRYRIVGSSYADIAEKRIAELEKENAELKEKLNKATEILKVVLNKWKEERWILQSEKEVKMIENVMKEAAEIAGSGN